MKYWKSIDELPIYYYYKVISTKDLIHLAYDLPANQNREYLTKTLQPAWDKIQIEYFDFMAKDKDFIASLEIDDKKMSVVKYFSHFNRLKNGK